MSFNQLQLFPKCKKFAQMLQLYHREILGSWYIKNYKPMAYKDKYQELVELSHSDNPMIRELADAWLISIGLQDATELNVSAFLLDLAINNVKGKITREEVSQRFKEHYGDNEPQTWLNGGYEIIPPDSPKIKEIEEYNRNLRPALYAELDKKKNRKNRDESIDIYRAGTV